MTDFLPSAHAATKYFAFLALSTALSISCALSADLAAPSAADDSLQKVRIFQDHYYDPNKNEGRGFSEFFTSIGIFLVGESYKDGEKIRTDVLQALNENAEVSGYFSQKEKAALANRIGAYVRDNVFSQGVSNQTSVAATKYVVLQLTQAIIDRVMEREGVSAPERRALWTKKIQAPFELCVKKAKTYSEADECRNAMQSDLSSNLGLAMTYELARKELGADTSTARAEDYRKCLYQGQGSKVCVLKSIRDGVLAKSKEQVIATAKTPLGDEGAKKLWETVSPAYQKCLKTADNSKKLKACVDKLTGQSGSEIVKQMTLKDGSVLSAFPDAKDQKKMAELSAATFGKCIDKNARENLRDESGILQSDNCLSQTLNVTAEQVSVATINSYVHQYLEESGKEISESSKQSLKACWNNESPTDKNNTCLKDVMKKLILRVGEGYSRKLPQGAALKEEEQKENLQKLSSCIDSNFPGNMILMGFPKSNMADCFAKTLHRPLAMKYAELKLAQEASKATVEKPKQDKLSEDLIEDQLDSCLGNKPDLSKMNSCVGSFDLALATEIGKLNPAPQNLALKPVAKDEDCVDCVKKIAPKTVLEADQQVTASNIDGLLQTIAKEIGKSIEKEFTKDSVDFPQGVMRIAATVKVAGSAESQKKVIENMQKSGALQLALKEIISTEFKHSLSQPGKSGRVPDAVIEKFVNSLLTEKNLKSEKGKKLEAMLVDAIHGQISSSGPSINALGTENFRKNLVDLALSDADSIKLLRWEKAGT